MTANSPLSRWRAPPRRTARARPRRGPRAPSRPRAGCARRRRRAGRAPDRPRAPRLALSFALRPGFRPRPVHPYSAASSGIGAAAAAAGPSARHPDAQECKQQLDVHRLGDIVRSAGIEALLAVALHRLGGDGDQRHVRKPGPRADLAHGLIAVHLGHHDVDQRDVHVRRLLQDQDAVLAALGMEHFDVMVLEHARQREDVADVVVDDQHLGAGELRHRAPEGAPLAGLLSLRPPGLCEPASPSSD